MKNRMRSRATVGLLFASLWMGSVSAAAGVGVSGATSVTELFLRLLFLAMGVAGWFLSFWYALSTLRPDEKAGEDRLVPVRVTVPVEPQQIPRRRRGL